MKNRLEKNPEKKYTLVFGVIVALGIQMGLIAVTPCHAIELNIVSPSPVNVYGRAELVQCKVNVDWGNNEKQEKTRNVMVSLNGKLYQMKSEDGKAYVGMVDTKGIRTENMTLDVIASETHQKPGSVSLASNKASVTVYLETPGAVLSDSILDDAADLD